MTNEEAIKMLEKMKARMVPLGPLLEGKSKDEEAVDMAIDALEKQIPKKAVGEHYAHMRCPSCNHRIPSGGGSSSRRRDNWCNYCGQAY